MASLEQQLISFSFEKALETKSDDKVANFGDISEISNVDFDRTHALMKRTGYTLLVTGTMSTPVTSMKGLATYRDELIGFDGQHLYSFIDSQKAWSDRGRCVVTNVKTDYITVGNNTNQQYPDHVVINGVATHAWYDGSTIYYTTVDVNTGATLHSPTVVASAVPLPAVRVVALNGSPVIIIGSIQQGVAATIKAYVVNVSQGGLGTPTSLVTDGNTQDMTFDVHVGPGATSQDGLHVFYKDTSGHFIYKAFSAALSLLSTVTIDNTVDMTSTTVPVSLWQSRASTPPATGYDIALGWFSLSGSTYQLKKCIVDSSYSIQYAQQMNLTTAAPRTITGHDDPVQSPPAGRILFSTFGTTDDMDYVQVVPYAASATSVSFAIAGTLRHSILASKPFIEGTTMYCLVQHVSRLTSANLRIPSQNTYFLIDVNARTVVGKALATQGGTPRNVYSPCPNAQLVVTGTYSISTQLATRLPGNDVFNATDAVATTAFDFSGSYTGTELGGNLHIPGAVTWMYDGRDAYEHGFLLYPGPVTGTIKGLGQAGHEVTSTNLGTGSHTYKFCYESTDACGNVHRSAPSIAITLSTTSGSAYNHFRVPTLAHTSKANVRVVGYRTLDTLAPGTDAGIYYRFTSLTSASLNDPTVDYVTINDTFSDTDINSNDVLYSVSELENNPARSCSVLATYKNRLVTGGFELPPDVRRVGISKLSQDSTGPVEFSDTLGVRVTDPGGPVVALGVMDDFVAIFKESSIYALNGDGPDDTGGGGDYSDPTLVSADVGCTDPATITYVPDQGLFFMSQRGLMLLDRSLRLSYKGSPAEEYNHQTFTGGILDHSKGTVTFPASDGDSVVYDYVNDKWSTRTIPHSIASVAWQGKHVFAKVDGTTYVGDTSTWKDGTSEYAMSFTTHWYNLQGIQGMQRLYAIYILGEEQTNTNAKLKVEIGYDYNDTFTETTTFDATTLLQSPPQWRWYQPTIRPKKQRCHAFRLRVTEVPAAAPAPPPYDQPGPILTAVSLLVGTYGKPRGPRQLRNAAK